jgi:RNA polymerase sigma-70 factor (ECF subfamily)
MIAAVEAVLPAFGDSGPAASPDARLFAGCRAGDRSSFEELFRVHGPRMKSVAANLLGDLAEAEDAVQEAFVKIFRSAGTFQGRSRFSTWIHRVVVNCCYDLLRRRRPTVSLDDAPPGSPSTDGPPPSGEDPAIRVALEQGLRSLPPRQRSAFVLFAIEGFSHREIGEILGTSTGNSKTLVFEAKKKLARLLENRSVSGGRRP